MFVIFVPGLLLVARGLASVMIMLLLSKMLEAGCLIHCVCVPSFRSDHVGFITSARPEPEKQPPASCLGTIAPCAWLRAAEGHAGPRYSYKLGCHVSRYSTVQYSTVQYSTVTQGHVTVTSSTVTCHDTVSAAVSLPTPTSGPASLILSPKWNIFKN